jgi:Holliday junction resolvase RusA-like endonuclease
VNVQQAIRLSIDGPPRAKGRPRFNPRGRAWTPRATRLAENTLAWEARKQMLDQHTRALVGPVEVRVVFHLATARRVDVDNLVKLVLDALNGIAWADDSQVVHITALKTIDRDHPRTEITATPAGALAA